MSSSLATSQIFRTKMTRLHVFYVFFAVKMKFLELASKSIFLLTFLFSILGQTLGFKHRHRSNINASRAHTKYPCCQRHWSYLVFPFYAKTLHGLWTVKRAVSSTLKASVTCSLLSSTIFKITSKDASTPSF